MSINQNFEEGLMVQMVLNGVVKMFALFLDVFFRNKKTQMNHWG
jgi:hypothetical protein